MKQPMNKTVAISDIDITKPAPTPVPESEPEQSGVRDGHRTRTASNYGDWRPGDDKKMGPDTDPQLGPALDSSGTRK